MKTYLGDESTKGPLETLAAAGSLTRRKRSPGPRERSLRMMKGKQENMRRKHILDMIKPDEIKAYDGPVRLIGPNKMEAYGGPVNINGPNTKEGYDGLVNVIEPYEMEGYDGPSNINEIYKMEGYERPETIIEPYEMEGYDGPSSINEIYKMEGYEGPETIIEPYEMEGYDGPVSLIKPNKMKTSNAPVNLNEPKTMRAFDGPVILIEPKKIDAYHGPVNLIKPIEMEDFESIIKRTDDGRTSRFINRMKTRKQRKKMSKRRKQERMLKLKVLDNFLESVAYDPREIDIVSNTGTGIDSSKGDPSIRNEDGVLNGREIDLYDGPVNLMELIEMEDNEDNRKVERDDERRYDSVFENMKRKRKEIKKMVKWMKQEKLKRRKILDKAVEQEMYHATEIKRTANATDA